mmetsp:Transcript_7161/g.18484  ORF Transcript_7161/g.18484 Transcript_7161/m.18484 type:complete len:291 (-) Transcript_7161:92-964(-)
MGHVHLHWSCKLGNHSVNHSEVQEPQNEPWGTYVKLVRDGVASVGKAVEEQDGSEEQRVEQESSTEPHQLVFNKAAEAFPVHALWAEVSGDEEERCHEVVLVDVCEPRSPSQEGAKLGVLQVAGIGQISQLHVERSNAVGHIHAELNGDVKGDDDEGQEGLHVCQVRHLPPCRLGRISRRLLGLNVEGHRLQIALDLWRSINHDGNLSGLLFTLAFLSRLVRFAVRALQVLLYERLKDAIDAKQCHDEEVHPIENGSAAVRGTALVVDDGEAPGCRGHPQGGYHGCQPHD